MNWPLAISPFTVADRLKIGWWLLRGHQMTAGPEVRRYEQRWERYTGAKHAIMVSNGSVANELIAIRRRERLIAQGAWPRRNGVVFPACNWVTSVSPWLRLGFEPRFVDVSANLCASADEIFRVLKDDVNRQIGTVFYVTLLGQATQLTTLRDICLARDVELMLDNCESSLSWTDDGWTGRLRHFCAVGTSSTSFYFSHPVTTGTEGGMVFCESEADADWFRMMRNHGLTRGMSHIYRNTDVHPEFDFNLPGTNARSSDLQAYMGSLTFDRTLAFSAERIRLGTKFYGALDKRKFSDITNGRCDNPLMALPILPNPTHRDGGCRNLPALLDKLGIEHRPIVGGNLLRHTAFKRHADAREFSRAQWIHDNGVYVGLHSGVTSDMVLDLAKALNEAK